MLQHIRSSWVFQNKAKIGWQIMDQAMKKLRHISHFAEPIAEDGTPPQFNAGPITPHKSMEKALIKAVEDLAAALTRHGKLAKDNELKKHSGVVINLDMMIQQEEYQRAEIEGWGKGL
jgi:bacterioferritin